MEAQLVASYERYVGLKNVSRQAIFRLPHIEEALLREAQMQRYLHALLGHKGEPPGLLY